LLYYKALPFDGKRRREREEGACIIGREVNLAAVVNLWCQTVTKVGLFVDFITFFPFICAADLKNSHTLLTPCLQHVASPIVVCHKYTFIQGAHSVIQEISWFLQKRVGEYHYSVYFSF